MAQSRRVRFTSTAQTGFIALLVAVLAGLAYWIGMSLTHGSGTYAIGVRFSNAAGLSNGSTVRLNGVDVGHVQRIVLLPDGSIDAILTIRNSISIPQGSSYTVISRFTGGSSVAVASPIGTGLPASPRRVLPIGQQARGQAPLTIDTLLHESRALANRSESALAMAREPGNTMLHALRGSQANGTATVSELRALRPAMLADMQTTIAQAKLHAAHAQAALRSVDRQNLRSIADSFQSTAQDMNRISAEMHALKRDPQMRANMVGVAAQLRAISQNMLALTQAMKNVTANAQTRAELSDAAARLHAVLKRL